MLILELSFKKNNYCDKIERLYVLGSTNVSMDPQGDPIIHQSQWNQGWTHGGKSLDTFIFLTMIHIEFRLFAELSQ